MSKFRIRIGRIKAMNEGEFSVLTIYDYVLGQLKCGGLVYTTRPIPCGIMVTPESLAVVSLQGSSLQGEQEVDK